jgi:hypothetical protein
VSLLAVLLGVFIAVNRHHDHNDSFFFFFETGFLCVALAVLESHSVDQAGLELRNPPASTFRVLGLKACVTTPGLNSG